MVRCEWPLLPSVGVFPVVYSGAGSLGLAIATADSASAIETKCKFSVSVMGIVLRHSKTARVTTDSAVRRASNASTVAEAASPLICSRTARAASFTASTGSVNGGLKRHRIVAEIDVWDLALCGGAPPPGLVVLVLRNERSILDGKSGSKVAAFISERGGRKGDKGEGERGECGSWSVLRNIQSVDDFGVERFDLAPERFAAPHVNAAAHYGHLRELDLEIHGHRFPNSRSHRGRNASRSLNM